MRHGLVPAILLLSFLAGVAPAQSLRFDFAPSPIAGKLDEKPQLSLVCPRVSEAPVINGNLDDAAWKRARRFGLSRGKPAQTAYVCFDDKALYFAMVCKNPPGREAVSKATDRDEGGVWRDDCIEMWLQPDLRQFLSNQFDVSVGNKGRV